MMHVHRLAIFLTVSLCTAGLVAAQGPEGPPKPGPEHKRLERFVGKWNGKGEMKPGPFGPAGTAAWTESCEWFEGGFHVVCTSEGSGPMGPQKGIGIIGYDPEKKVYTYYGVDNMGWADMATGTVSGSTWTYTSALSVGGKTLQSRYSVEEVSPTHHKFKWETSEDGKKWDVMMEGEASK